MYLTSLSIKNIRSYKNADIDFSKSINLFVGPNNHGKSTILNAIHFLQGNFLDIQDIRLNEGNGEIIIGFDGDDLYKIKSNIQFDNSVFNSSPHAFDKKINISLVPKVNKIIKKNSPEGYVNFLDFPKEEPGNLIYPFLSKRKVVSYSENMNLQSSTSVKGNFEDLYAKIDRLCNEDFLPAASEYKKACLDILGYRISTVNSSGGKKAALIIRNLEHIPITSMGEGIVNILGLIVDLCLAEKKIFLIEELENDIHPKALKGLLNLIIEKSKNNQFFISTHSNIIVKYLGADIDTKIFKVAMAFGDSDYRIPTSTVIEVSKKEEDRRLLLEELGYEFNDFGLWESWLFLEESSAERIIRDYLIPWFCLKLENKLRTYSAAGSSEIEIKFKDFNNLFVFLHLTPSYKNKAWVILDAGEEENKIIKKMKSLYVEKNQWNESNFLQFSKHDFEEFYPNRFQTKFAQIKGLNKDEKRKEKEKLLKEVIQWIEEDKEVAKKEFQSSSNEVINILQQIAKSVQK